MGMLRKLDEARFFLPYRAGHNFCRNWTIGAGATRCPLSKLASDVRFFGTRGPATTAMVFPADVSVIGPHAVVVEGTYSAKWRRAYGFSPRRSYAHGRRTLIRFSFERPEA